MEVNTRKEYDFTVAWGSLFEGDKVITSKKTRCSYKLEDNNLKFYNPLVSWWQDCDYILAKEMLDVWYITKIIK